MSPLNLFSAVIESFVDGILILSDRYELIHANEPARRLCPSLVNELPNNEVTQEVWQVCQSLIDSRDVFPDADIIIESEVKSGATVKLRIRARWLKLEASDSAFILVTLEDCHQTRQNMAFSIAKKYHLTPREAEVWLLRQGNHSYKEIAAQLYITINTVKKHLKSIHAKQQEISCS